MKILFLALVALMASFFGEMPDSQAFTKTDVVVETDSTKVYFWTWGLVENPNMRDYCDLETQKKYGFSYKSKGHCMMDDLPRLKRYMSHNQAVEKELEARHGAEWRDKYDAEVAQCRIDQDTQ